MILAAAVTLNIMAFACLVAFILYYKTPFFYYLFVRIKKSLVQQFIAYDTALVRQGKEMKDVVTVYDSRLEKDHLIILMNGYEPKSIDLNNPPNVCRMFLETSDTRITYNSFEIIETCIRWFEQNGDERLVRLFWHLFTEWRGSFRSAFLEDYAWYDHCAAARLAYLRHAILTLNARGLLTRKQYAVLIKELLVHGQFLSRNEMYDYVTNHGLIVDGYLLQAAVTLPDIPQKDRWIQRSLARSLGRIDHYISDDGVPLEGSTTYWYAIYDMYHRIIQTAQQAEIEPDRHALQKLQKCRDFLSIVNINGKMNRLGNAAGGHDVPAVAPRPVQADGYYLYVYDSGLIVLNAVKNCKVISQVMLNVQDVKPYVHRHEDSLVLGLYHKGVFWINSPGTYSKEKTQMARFVKSHRNQSLVYHQGLGYSDTCRIEEVIENRSGFSVTSVVNGQEGKRLYRRVRFDLPNEELTVEDASQTFGSIVSQYLLNSKTEAEVATGLVKLVCGDETIGMSVIQNVELSHGKISYDRNHLDDAIMLRMVSSDNKISIRLANNLGTLEVNRTKYEYPYAKRIRYTRSLLAQTALRIHQGRLKQVAMGLSVELAIVTAVQLLIWL